MTEQETIKQLQQENAQHISAIEKMCRELETAKMKAHTDAETIRTLRELIGNYEGQIEAFKFCIRNGVNA